MQHNELTFTTHDGLELYAQTWQPEGEPKAALAIIHGIGEHSGRYMNLVDALVPEGFAVWGVDLRGHGHAAGQRGHIDRWSDYRGDADHFLQLVRNRHPGSPIFLLGHSMGSLVVLDYVMRSDRSDSLQGVVISGVPIDPVGVGSPLLIAVAKALSRIWPRFSLSPGIEPETLTRDPEDQRAVRDDPLAHPKTTARWGTESLDTVAWVEAHPERVNLPILMVHGGADPLNTAEGARAWYERITYPDKTLHIYPGSRHEVHNDLDHAELTRDMINWMDDHLPSRVDQERSDTGTAT